MKVKSSLKGIADKINDNYILISKLKKLNKLKLRCLINYFFFVLFLSSLRLSFQIQLRHL